MELKRPYLLFLGDAADQLAAKTAQGVYDWRPEFCLGQMRLEDCHADLGLDDLSLAEARDQGAKTLVIGVANRGGVIGDHWITPLTEALELGYDIASGLHARLADIPSLKEAADRNGCHLFDLRHTNQVLPVGNGKPRSGKRLLAVGTDCSVGKMYTTLALEKEMKNRGMKVDFRATGQTGIFIAGSGISVDAVVADFISGAVELLSPENDGDHWDIIEGQGSLFHASYAGVSLGLLHGAQADALVMCHEPTRDHMRGLPGRPLPDIMDCIRLNEEMARMTNPAAKCIGISVNTKNMGECKALSYLKELEADTGYPCVDPYLTGVGRLVDAL